MVALGWAPGLRTVFDAPRTAALIGSCQQRTEGSGLGSPKEPPVLDVETGVVVQSAIDVQVTGKCGIQSGSRTSPSRPVVKFTVGCSDSEEEDGMAPDGAELSNTFAMDNLCGSLRDAGKSFNKCENPPVTQTSGRERLQSESSSGVSTHFSSSNSSIVSGLSIEDEEDDVNSELDSAILSDASVGTCGTTAAVPAPNEGFGVEIGPFPINHFVVNPAPSVEIVWSYAIHGDAMVVYAPASIQKVCGINDAFVTLLEYGENELHCSHAVVLIERASPDKASLQRMFTFLGFTPLPTKRAPRSLRGYAQRYSFMMTGFDELQENDSDLDPED